MDASRIKVVAAGGDATRDLDGASTGPQIGANAIEGSQDNNDDSTSDAKPKLEAVSANDLYAANMRTKSKKNYYKRAVRIPDRFSVVPDSWI